MMCTNMSVKIKGFSSNSTFDTRQNPNVDEPLSFRAFPALIKNMQFSKMLSKLVKNSF